MEKSGGGSMFMALTIPCVTTSAVEITSDRYKVQETAVCYPCCYTYLYFLRIASVVFLGLITKPMERKDV